MHMTALTQAQRDATVITLDKKTVHLGDLLGQPLVLAFFPAAFTGTCTAELCAFRDSMARFNALQARVYGISIDTPYSLQVFSDQNHLSFPLLSDANREAIRAFNVVWPDLSGVRDVSKRAVFVLDDAGNILYQWVGPKLGVEPPYDEIVAALERPSA
jgi:peroxiredoxin